jgi:hypothetical protein
MGVRILLLEMLYGGGSSLRDNRNLIVCNYLFPSGRGVLMFYFLSY